jgi:hypothetical protein
LRFWLNVHTGGIACQQFLYYDVIDRLFDDDGWSSLTTERKTDVTHLQVTPLNSRRVKSQSGWPAPRLIISPEHNSDPIRFESTYSITLHNIKRIQVTPLGPIPGHIMPAHNFTTNFPRSILISSLGSSEIITTRLWDGQVRNRVQFPAGTRIFLFATAPRPALWPIQSSTQYVPGHLPPGVKLSGREFISFKCRS